MVKGKKHIHDSGNHVSPQFPNFIFFVSSLSMKQNRTKRFLILGLSFLVMLNSVGIFLLTYIETGFHRAIEYSELSNKNSELLSLSAKEFSSISWIGEHDFIFNGEVYDCAGISSSKGKINLQCHSDAEETNLKNFIGKNFDDGNKNVPLSKSMKGLFKIFPVFQNLVATTNFISTENFSFHYSQYGKQHPQSAEISLNSPPPEIA